MTREIGKEVPGMCTYAEAMVKKGLSKDSSKRRKKLKKNVKGPTTPKQN